MVGGGMFTRNTAVSHSLKADLKVSWSQSGDLTNTRMHDNCDNASIVEMPAALNLS